MPKLKLNIDELRVESFDVTSRRATPRGTVHGADVGEPITLPEPDNNTFFRPCPSDGTCPDTWCGLRCTGGCMQTQVDTCFVTCQDPRCIPMTGFETCGNTCGCTVGAGDVQCA